MRIVSWNCYRGECRERAAQLEHLHPDLVFLQECGVPAVPQDSQCVWFGGRPSQGVGVVGTGDWHLEAWPQSPDVPDSTYPVSITGPATLHALGVWAQQRPTYVRSIVSALDEYRAFLTTKAAIVVGDFNSHWRWDRSSSVNHMRLVEKLSDEFGLVSVYHAFTGREPGEEQPTLYWQWKQEQPFHVDYCFIPESWLPLVRSVEVGTFADWEGASDHRPLIIDIDIPSSSGQEPPAKGSLRRD